MRIILHIGQSKTGTSAIQAFLSLNRRTLRDAGILYPTVRVNGMPIDMGNHNSVADALVGLPRFPNLSAKEYFDQFMNKAEKYNVHTMILSAEHFIGGEPRVWDVPDESTYYDLYCKKIQALAKFIKGYDVTIIAYLRPQVDWLASTVSQNIRIEGLVAGKKIYESDEQFFNMFKPMLKYAKMLDCWMTILEPNERIVIPYIRKNLHQNSSIADFLLRLGMDNIKTKSGNPSIQINSSLSREYIEVKKILNLTPKSKTVERVTIKCLETLSNQNDAFIPYSLSPALVQNICGFVELENKKLNETYFSPQNLSFPPMSIDMNSSQEVTQQQVSDALTKFKHEYNKLNYHLLWLNLKSRELLRRHGKPLHGVIHQIRRFQRWWLYRDR